MGRVAVGTVSALRTLRKARRVNRSAGILLGDVIAVGSGRGTQRVANRLIGRVLGRAMRSVWR